MSRHNVRDSKGHFCPVSARKSKHQFDITPQLNDMMILGWCVQLVAGAADRWARLVRTGPTEEFNQAQRDLMLACGLKAWWWKWIERNSK